MTNSTSDGNQHLRIFLVECGSPLDRIESRSESEAVGGMARLIGHSVLTFDTFSKRAFEEACAYIGSICETNDLTPDVPLCLHISCHGSSDGLAFGADTIVWSELLQVIQPVLTQRYEGKRILVISACSADDQKLSNAIKREHKRQLLIPPQYIFYATGEVAWDDAAVGWTLLYHQLPNIDLDHSDEVKAILQKIEPFGLKLRYARWDDAKSKYMHFPKKPK